MSRGQDFNVSASQTTVELTSLTHPYEGIASKSSQADVGKLVFRSMVIAISTIGTFANVLVIYVLCVSKELKKHALNVLFINQLSLDLFSCVWLVITYLLKNTNVHLDGTAGYWLCSVVMSDGMVWCGLYGSKVNLVTIAAERYLKIVHPLWHKNNFRPWMTFLAVAVAWLIGGFYSFLLSFLTSVSANGACIWGVVWSSDLSKSAYAVATFVIFFALVLVSFLFCYGHIIRTLRRQARVFAVQHVNNPLAKTNNMQALRVQINAIKTMIIVSAAFVVCWLPCDVTSTIYVFYDGSSLLSQIYYVTLFLAIFNVCLNPFIYAAKYNTVKGYFLRLVNRPESVAQPVVSTLQLQTTARHESEANTA
jgi:hypothetical protein